MWVCQRKKTFFRVLHLSFIVICSHLLSFIVICCIGVKAAILVPGYLKLDESVNVKSWKVL